MGTVCVCVCVLTSEKLNWYTLSAVCNRGEERPTMDRVNVAMEKVWVDYLRGERPLRRMRVFAALACCDRRLRTLLGPEVRLSAARSIQIWWRERALPRRELMRRMVTDWLRGLDGFDANDPAEVVYESLISPGDASSILNTMEVPYWHPSLRAARRVCATRAGVVGFVLLYSLVYVDGPIRGSTLKEIIIEWPAGVNKATTPGWFRHVVSKAQTLDADYRIWIWTAMMWDVEVPDIGHRHGFPSTYHATRKYILNPPEAILDHEHFMGFDEADYGVCFLRNVMEEAFDREAVRAVVTDIDDAWSADDNRIWRKAMRYLNFIATPADRRLVKYRIRRFVDAAKDGRRLPGFVFVAEDTHPDANGPHVLDAVGEPDETFVEVETDNGDSDREGEY